MNMNGWRRPQRVRTLSEKAPTNGSEMASTMLAMRNAVPHRAGETPSTWL